jgi:biopolymer transport protein ExbD
MSTAEESDDQPFLQRRRPGEAELDFTSMIDVTFLLLIFFMVGAKMETTKPVDLPISTSGQGIEVSRATAFVLRQEDNQVVDREPVVELENGLPSTLAEVRQIVRTRVDEGRREFIIRAERRVPNGLVQALARAVQETEGVKFFVAVEEQK